MTLTVQANSSQVGSPTGGVTYSNQSCAFLSNVVAGHLLIARFGYSSDYQNVDTNSDFKGKFENITCTDTTGNVWTYLGYAYPNTAPGSTTGDGDAKVQAWGCIAKASGACTVTVDWSGGTQGLSPWSSGIWLSPCLTVSEHPAAGSFVASTMWTAFPGTHGSFPGPVFEYATVPAGAVLIFVYCNMDGTSTLANIPTQWMPTPTDWELSIAAFCGNVNDGTHITDMVWMATSVGGGDYKLEFGSSDGLGARLYSNGQHCGMLCVFNPPSSGPAKRLRHRNILYG